MPKTTDIIHGEVSKKKLIIQKSRPLLALCGSNLSLAEFKLLDAYLARIDSHDEECKTVVFTKKELERLFGINRIRRQDLQNYTDKLMSFITIDLTPEECNWNYYRKINLFDQADIYTDSTGQCCVILRCSPAAMQYMFNIENYGYLRYRLSCVLSLTNLYSYLLFLYLEANKFRGAWDVQLDALKIALRCKADIRKGYRDYSDFKRYVLEKSQKEIIAKTETRFTYKEIRHGKTVIGLHFEVERMPLIGQATEVVCKDIKEALKPLEFTVEQYDELWNLLLKIPLETLKNTKLTREEETQKDVIRYNGTAKRRLDRTLQKIKQGEEGAMKTRTIEFMYADDEEKMKKELLALYRSSYLKRIAEKSCAHRRKEAHNKQICLPA